MSSFFSFRARVVTVAVGLLTLQVLLERLLTS